MRIFRKLKYRLRRFIISLITILSLCCVFVVSASADVLPVSDSGIDFEVDPFYFNGTDYIFSGTYDFIPGTTIDTKLYVPVDHAFGLQAEVISSEHDKNLLNVTRGVLHFKFSFVTNIYFTSPTVPAVAFGKFTSPGEHVSSTVDPSDIRYSSVTEPYDGSGANRRFLVTTELFIDSSVIPYSEFLHFSFFIERANAPTSNNWSIVCKDFLCEVLTGSDVPKFAQPDTSAKDALDDTEGQLNDSFSSFNNTDRVFNGLSGSGVQKLFSAVKWWSQYSFGMLFDLPFIEDLLTLSLAIGIFSFLFGLFGSIISRSVRSSRSAPKKSSSNKGG